MKMVEGITKFLRQPHPFMYGGIFLAFVVWMFAVNHNDGSMAVHMRNASIWEVAAEFVAVMVVSSIVFALLLVMFVAIGGTEWTNDKRRAVQGLPLLTYGNFFKWTLLGVGTLLLYLLLWPIWKRLFAGIRYSAEHTRWFPDSFQ